MLEGVIYALEVKKAFVRSRVPMEIRALGILLVYMGLSYRRTSQIVSLFTPVSHEAVRKWYHKAAKILDVTIEKKYRPEIAIDETKIRIGDRWYYLWVAIDIHTWDILGVYLSSGRSMLDTMIFIRKILKYTENKPKFYVDGGPWYPGAFKRLGLEWEHVTFGKRNPIEQWFSILKRRINTFYRKWSKNTTERAVYSWSTAFIALFNIDFRIRKGVIS